MDRDEHYVATTPGCLEGGGGLCGKRKGGRGDVREPPFRGLGGGSISFPFRGTCFKKSVSVTPTSKSKIQQPT